MIADNIICSEHPYEICGIYLGQNKQKFERRKLCFQCISENQIPNEQIILVHNFGKLIQERFRELKIGDKLTNDKPKSFFKNALFQQIDEMEKEIMLIFSSIKDSINAILEEERELDDKYLKLNKINFNLYEYSKKDLEFLIKFLEGNNFDEWIERKKVLKFLIDKVEALLKTLIQNSYMTNFLIEDIRFNLQDFILFQNTQDKPQETIDELVGWYNLKNQLKQTTFYLRKFRNGDKIYQKDGQVLRKEKQQKGQKQDYILNNFEQMKYLEFKGQFGVKGYKIKRWDFFWKDIKIGGGLYNINGQKQGNWVELCENYWDQKQVTEIGCYQKGKRIGEWNYFFNNTKIGGGAYNDRGEEMRIGKWIELCDSFRLGCQLLLSGEYNSGKKVGNWDMLWRDSQDKQFLKIGGGQFDQEQGKKKIGKWIEYFEEFQGNILITLIGEYNRNGMKVGSWDVMYEGVQIAGGSYDQEGGQKKIGKWVELDEGFKDYNYITYEVEYNLKGIKMGNWIKTNGLKKQQNFEGLI